MKHNLKSAGLAAVATVMLVVGAAGPAYASDKKPAPLPRAETDTRMVCVVSETTGSILRKKECHTRAEWVARTGVDPLKRR